MGNEVGRLYDQLARFESLLVGRLGRYKSYPIHKKLDFRSSGSAGEFRDLNQWILKRVDLNDGTKVLDAGCGVGQTLFEICENHDVSALGISVSEAEIEIARRAMDERDLSGRCSFQVQSFDDAFDASFDLIIAVESIKHSENLDRTLANLAGHLTENGQMVIVDDFLRKDIADLESKEKFIAFWSLHHLIDEKRCVDILNRANVHVEEIVDLTPCVRKTNRFVSALSMNLLSALRFLLPIPIVRNLCSIFIGGLLLDRFYAKGIMEYKVIRFGRKGGVRETG